MAENLNNYFLIAYYSVLSIWIYIYIYFYKMPILLIGGLSGGGREILRVLKTWLLDLLFENKDEIEELDLDVFRHVIFRALDKYIKRKVSPFSLFQGDCAVDPCIFFFKFFFPWAKRIWMSVYCTHSRVYKW